MIPAGMTTGARAAPARASRPARSSRWPAGTLAAAGTIPARTMSVNTTLVISQGHHPANNRSAIPTRAYESGSGHGHDAAPAGHPHPPRSPPAPSITPVSPGGRHHRGPAGPPQGRLSASAPPSAPRPLTRTSRPRAPAPIRGSAHACPDNPPRYRIKNPPNVTSHAQELQSLDEPLHMSAPVGAEA